MVDAFRLGARVRLAIPAGEPFTNVAACCMEALLPWIGARSVPEFPTIEFELLLICTVVAGST